MSKSKPYSAVNVKRLAPQQLTEGRDGLDLVVGLDIGKFQILAVPRWSNGILGRPWRIDNPSQIPLVLDLLRSLAGGRRLVLAMESSGTYGDALRQALHDAGLPLLRVSPKAAHDYAEIFDGVPSQHDGKDAAVVAELAALGKAAPWHFQQPAAWEQQLASWVDWADAQRQLLVLWAGRLEGLLARHWPEATRVLRLTSATLVRTVAHYGGPQALVADTQAAARLTRWGGRWLAVDKVQQLLHEAKSSVGIRQSPVQIRQVQCYAAEALQARRQLARSRRELARLVSGQPELVAQAAVVGAATAAVLWVDVGAASNYPCGPAYRKAMGLNLTERSSGTVQGKLHISKRGQPQTRRWLYLAALRLSKKAGIRPWYQAKKQRDGHKAKRAVVAVMRKLALALYQVGARGATFAPERLFPGRTSAAESKQ